MLLPARPVRPGFEHVQVAKATVVLPDVCRIRLPNEVSTKVAGERLDCVCGGGAVADLWYTELRGVCSGQPFPDTLLRIFS